jgi:O-succinylbenzoate synthase
LDGFVYPTDIEASERWFEDDIIEPLIHVRNGETQIPQSGFRVDEATLDRYTMRTQAFSR